MTKANRVDLGRGVTLPLSARREAVKQASSEFRCAG